MDNEFYIDTNKMFEEHLGYNEFMSIRIKDINRNIVLENINYDKLIRFDSEFNIYKLVNESWELVNNENFKAVVKIGEKYL